MNEKLARCSGDPEGLSKEITEDRDESYEGGVRKRERNPVTHIHFSWTGVL